MGKYVFSTAKAIVAHVGGTVRLYENEVWAADDPVVKANPDAFSDEPVSIRRTPGPVTPTAVEEATAAAEVEDTTAEPGAKRRTTKRG